MADDSGYDGTWIRRFRAVPAAPVRLLCLPHAGGSATFYFPVAQALAPQIDVLAVQYPGRQDRRLEPTVTDLAVLAERIVAALPDDDRPLALFGHSMGATVAYEVARRTDPVALFVSGRRAPDRTRDDGIHRLPRAEFIADLRRLGGSDAGVFGDADLLDLVLPVIRSDYRAAETYRVRPGPRLTCPVRAFAGSADPRVPVEELRHWAGFTDGPFDLHVVDGGHFFVTERLAEVLGVVTDDLRRIAAGSVLFRK